MKNVLVTGASGFLGGRLVRLLDQTGKYHISCAVRSPGNSEESPDRQVCLFDLSDLKGFEKSLKNIDTVVHLAGLNAVSCAANPDNGIECNAIATKILAEKACQAGVKHFITVTTCHVYGRSLAGTVTEKTVLKPTHPYSLSHQKKEELLESGSFGDMRTTVFRLSNGVGFPSTSHVNCWHLLVNDIAKQLIETGTVHLKTNGKGLRDFIPVADVVSVIQSCIDKEAEESHFNTFNLSSGRSFSIREMTDLVCETYTNLFRSVPEIILEDNIPGDETAFLISNRKLLSHGYRLSLNYAREIQLLFRMLADWMKFDRAENHSI